MQYSYSKKMFTRRAKPNRTTSVRVSGVPPCTKMVCTPHACLCEYKLAFLVIITCPNSHPSSFCTASNLKAHQLALQWPKYTHGHSPTHKPVTFWKFRPQVWTQYTYGLLYMYSTYKGVQLKSKLRRTGTKSAAAWPPCCLRHRPAVFIRHPSLTALSFPQWDSARVFLKCNFNIFKLRKSGSVCTGLPLFSSGG